ncbi:hypothetical protein TNCV_5121971, partial [Trichonephila clavipes]
ARQSTFVEMARSSVEGGGVMSVPAAGVGRALECC